MKENTRYRIFISGNIHYFGFRHFAASEAIQAGISGFAQYSGSSLLIEAEGTTEQLNPFIEWCKKGPQGCNIQSFQMVEIPAVHSSSFKILPVKIINIEELLTGAAENAPIPEAKKIKIQL